MRVAALLSALLFVAGAAAILSFPAHHDTAWLLYVAQRMLDGAVPYRDILEVNPPLILWLAALPELVARATRLWDVPVARLLVLLLAALSWVACQRLLRRYFGADSSEPLLLGLLLVWLLVTFPGLENGQREHLATLLVAPWLLLAACLAAGKDMPAPVFRILIGIAAGIGFALKPYFLLPWALVEGFLLLRAGRRSPLRAELLALLAVWVVYGLLVLAFARGYFQLAGLAALSYGAYARANLLAIALMPQGLLSVSSLLAWLFTRRMLPERALGDVLALAGLGFFTGVLLQHKGWGYHWVPGTTLAILLWGCVILRAMRRWTPARALRPVQAATAVVLCLLLLGATAGTFRQARRERERMRGGLFHLPETLELVQRYGRGGAVAALATTLHVGFPLVRYADVPWGLRVNSIWWLSGVYAASPLTDGQPFRSPDEMSPTEKWFFQGVVEDFLGSLPTLVFVDRIPPARVPAGFQFLPYFAQDARFRELLSRYRELPPLGRYRVLVRVQ